MSGSRKPKPTSRGKHKQLELDPRLKGHFEVDIATSMPLANEVSFESVLTKIEARVMHAADRFGEGEKKQVGRACAYVIRFDECNSELSVDELGDGYSGNIADIWEALIVGDNGELLDEYEIFHRNVLLIDNVVIDAGFHGLGLGRAMVQRIIQLFARDHEAVALKPFALQWSCNESDPDEAKREAEKYGVPHLQSKQAHAKVAKVWESMGFQRFKDSDIWILNTIYQHPNCLLAAPPFEDDDVTDTP